MPVRRKSIGGVVALVAALLSLVVFVSVAGAVGRAVHTKVCGNFGGPHWSAGGGSGAQYGVYAVNGASCSLALRWAPRLAKQRPKGAHYLLTGPSGWGCAGQFALPHAGFCALRGTQQVFGWAPKLR